MLTDRTRARWKLRNPRGRTMPSQRMNARQRRDLIAQLETCLVGLSLLERELKEKSELHAETATMRLILASYLAVLEQSLGPRFDNSLKS